ncbi:MAG: ParA family protein [Planctomycetes bacterium]|nr:ParA family protein [Planctomycetota bacterium]
MRSIVLANQKGGVGKTTSAIHLAHGLALTGKRVALVDLDPQGNATVAVQGMEGGEAAEGALGFLTPIDRGLWLLPSSGNPAIQERDAKIDLGKLRGLVEALSEQLDWLVMDCPPRLDEWGWAGIQLCDEVLVPVQAEFFSMHGLSQMMQSLEVASKDYPGKARLRGILPTMVDFREAVAIEILEDLRRNLGSLVLQSTIFRDAQLVEAASHGRSAFLHCPWSKGALCYAGLVRELSNG